MKSIYGWRSYIRQLLLLLASITSTVIAFSPLPQIRSNPVHYHLLPSVSSSSINTELLEIGTEVGSGSYGTVHLCQYEGETAICKRAWDAKDLNKYNDPKERAERCQYYFGVEKHCFEKLQLNISSTASTAPMPSYKGTFKDSKGYNWMVFGLISQSGSKYNPAPSLDDVIKLDWQDQHASHRPSGEDHHHLYMIQKELGMKEDATFADVLDIMFGSLLRAISFVHDNNLVHRDVKPSNLLLDAETQSLKLIDFGSAADMDTDTSSWFGFKRERIGLEDPGRVAVSPIYSAPEVFIQPERSPFAFDVFSSGLILCQLVFNLLDERTDAGFHQQIIDEADCDLDIWLDRNMISIKDIRPAGLEEALGYFGERPGLWSLLKEMLQKDPEKRITASAALDQLELILLEDDTKEELKDGPFFELVLEQFEICEIPFDDDEEVQAEFQRPRPLQFIASFQRSKSLGLILSEAHDDDEMDDDMDETALQQWKTATAKALPGDVFVKGLVPNGQADRMTIFEIGDQLQGVGEFLLAQRGFAHVLEMLEQQPLKAKTVKLQFQRAAKPLQTPKTKSPKQPHLVRVVGEGAWSLKGRRNYQEDAFVLHETQVISTGSNVLIAGVFDGHGGTAASKSASQLLPSLLQVSEDTSSLQGALDEAWKTTCDTYRNGCNEDSGLSCIADYDPKEGILVAETGGGELVAGTTAAVMVMENAHSEEGTDEVTILNCGDSRTLIIGTPSDGSKSVVHFVTRDHSPSCDIEQKRLQRGIDEGLDYSLPQCSISRWWVQVDDWQYAVSRSLEGLTATSKGVVSDADYSRIKLSEMDRTDSAILLGSDGLFESMDNAFIGNVLIQYRKNGMSAVDAAKAICQLAIEKGSADNVSAVILYLE